MDFDLEPESPGSPIDECEYSRLIETTTHTPQPADLGPESGYVCASPISTEGSLASQSPNDGPYFDPETSETERSAATDYHDCIGSYEKEGVISSIFENVHNGALKMRPSTGTIIKVRTPPVLLTNGVGLHTAADGGEGDGDSASSHSTTTISSCSSNGDGTDKSEATVTNSTLVDEAVEVDVDLSQEENLKNVMCREQEAEDTWQDDLDALKQLMTSNNAEQDQQNADSEPPLTNGHSPCGEEEDEEESRDEVDRCSAAARQKEDEQVEIKNELIILECLRVIDATPEASPEPESRADQDVDGKLKVTDTEIDGDADTDGDGMDDRPQRVRRCSSLKTGKTPPGTPGRKKIVRFADVLGLDLAAVRTFMDEMPKIPKSAYEDLDLPEAGGVSVSLGPRVNKVLMPLFQQPGALAGFLDVIRDRHVSLESCAVTDPVTMTISGSVRVRNLDFHKSVYVRYTTDAWRTYSDLQANYVENSCDGFSDKFTFTVYGNALQVGERIELATRFHCKGQILWDNNFGANYCFQCMPVTTTARSTSAPAEMQPDQWHGASFY